MSLIIAAAIAVAAVIVLGDPDSDEAAEAPTATATVEPGEDETPAPTATPRPTPTPAPLLTSGSVKELSYKEGDTVRLRVRSSKPEHVHVHGYDIMKDVVPGKTTTIAFKADITGIFEVEFEGSGEQIASLKVEP